MISFDAPLCILSAFLLLTLVVGIHFSRKKNTFRTYAVGNKQFATATLVATVLATAYSGGGLARNVEQVHELGLYWIIVSILGDLGLWVVGWLALRMGAFMHNLSMAETIGSIYGKCPRVIVALCSIGSSVTMVAMQVHVMASSIGICIHTVDPKLITVCSTLILIFYSSFGGIRTVVFTDVVQFMTFAVILPFFSWFIFMKLGKPFSEIFPLLQEQDTFQLSTIFHYDMNLIAMVALVLSILASYIDAPILHRVYMSSGPTQARNVFRYAVFFGICINMVICLIGLFIFIGAPEASAVKVWDYIMTDIPPVFKGLLSVSLLAMAMSTADSSLHSGAIAVGHDMLESIRCTKTYPYQLQLTRIASIFIGLFAMGLTFYYSNLLDLLKLNLGLYLPITVAPFILAVFGFRGTSHTVLIGMASGVLTILAWNKWVEPSTGIDGSFIAMAANGLTMVTVHYLLKIMRKYKLSCAKATNYL
ncbi:MAG: sodium:solute symporter family protein [Candidatus Cardinium sp.]|nr:sodium:solute symporter family protein [Candidatus Cardinium sp.]